MTAPERTVLAEGLRFPEGPVWLGPGRVALTEIQGQCVSLWEHGRVSRVAPTGGGANGATLGPDGALWVANNGGHSLGHDGPWRAPDAIPGRIQRVTLAGEVRDVAVDLPGPAPHRPNDLCFGPDGRLYFTDPHTWEGGRGAPPGRVVRLPLGGRPELLAEVPRFPNGIAFGPDDRLYVAQSYARTIVVLDPESGTLLREHCRLPRGYPDGFCFDRTGRLYVAGSLGDVLAVFEPDGRLAAEIDMGAGSEPTNCCLGDGVLYVTVAGRGTLESLAVGAEPLPLHPARG